MQLVIVNMYQPSSVGVYLDTISTLRLMQASGIWQWSSKQSSSWKQKAPVSPRSNHRMAGHASAEVVELACIWSCSNATALLVACCPVARAESLTSCQPLAGVTRKDSRTHSMRVSSQMRINDSHSGRPPVEDSTRRLVGDKVRRFTAIRYKYGYVM